MVRARPLRREQLAVLGALAVLTAAAWALTLSQMRDMTAMGGPVESPPAFMPPADAMDAHAGGMPVDAPGGSPGSGCSCSWGCGRP